MDFVAARHHRVKEEVFCCKYKEGPFKGGENGERQFFYDFSESTRKPGTFHVLDSAKIKIFFKGNSSTCARCHQTRASCPGEGYAKDCEENGGTRVTLADHMKKLWSDIGFTPSTFTLPEDYEEVYDDPNTIPSDKPKISAKPPPKKALIPEEMAAKHDGLQINNLPADLSEEEVLRFLQEKVSGSLQKENYERVSKSNTTIYIRKGLTEKEVKDAIKLLHRHENGEKKFEFKGGDRRFLYCKPMRDLTPEKAEKPAAATTIFPSSDRREKDKEKDAKKNDFAASPTQPKIDSLFKCATPPSTPSSLRRLSTSILYESMGISDNPTPTNPPCERKRKKDLTASPTGVSPPSRNKKIVK